MKKRIHILLLIIFIHTFYPSFAQNTSPAIAWQKTLGGSGSDVLTAMCVKKDKSSVLCGYSNSASSGSKTSNSFGGYDYWIIKLDSSGNTVWNKTYGGSKDDFAAAIISTSDGGYLVGGSSISDSSGSKTANSYGFSYDYWIIKLDASGNKVWDKTMGGIYTERLTALAEMPGGEYIVGGYSYSTKTGSKKEANLGTESNADYWTVVLNADGTEQAQFVFGGKGHDVLTSLSPAGTGGFCAAGYTYSEQSKPKTKALFGNNDYWIIRSDLKGVVLFEGEFGGKLSDYLTCMQVLPDGALIAGGYSNSYASNFKSEPFFGTTDYWLIKLKPNGNKQWDKTLSGVNGGDYMTSVQQTKDMGFIAGGYSNSSAGNAKTENSKGGYDFWIIKLDSLGNMQWNKTLGGSKDDKLSVIYETSANDFIVAGTSASPKSSNKSANSVGSTDYWVLRLNNAKPSPTQSSMLAVAPLNAHSSGDKYQLEIMPNPVKNVLTIKYRAAASGKAAFTLYDANGKTLVQAALNSSYKENTHTFNIAQLPAGAYYVVMNMGATTLTKAFTKE